MVFSPAHVSGKCPTSISPRASRMPGSLLDPKQARLRLLSALLLLLLVVVRDKMCGTSLKVNHG